MKKLTVALVSGGLLMASAAFGGSQVHWGYSGDEGAEHWGSLDAEFALCATGRNQSPVDLADFIEADLPELTFGYQSHASEILNNGHTVQVNYEAGSTLTLNGHAYELKQFHFHAPSENHINGKSYPLEAHYVHADAEGNLAVAAIMFEEGQSNDVIKALWEQMPEQAGDKHPLSSKVNASDLLPENREYYRFNGSLTTPPCTEGVRWLVMKEPVSVSAEQVEAFSHVMHHPNNRPIQATHARPILQ